MKINLNDLDFSEAGEWPKAIRVATVLILFCVILFLLYWGVTKKQIVEMEAMKSSETELRAGYEFKHSQAVNIDAYREQLSQVRSSYKDMLNQLPDSAEVAKLLIDISMSGLDSGLEFELFEPQGEIEGDFYAELPILIRITGDYHQMGAFSEALSKLPRIVTLNNLTISPKSPVSMSDRRIKKQKTGTLVMTVTAKTYRYLSEEEVDDKAKEQAKALLAKGGKK